MLLANLDVKRELVRAGYPDHVAHMAVAQVVS